MNEQFLKRMQGYLQEEYEEYLKTLDEDAYRGLRVNTAKLSVDQFHDLKVCASQPSSICPESFYIPKDIKGLGNHPAHLAGLFYMQEPSAASAVEVLDVQRNDWVLDMCAAPGGKSTQIAAKLQDRGVAGLTGCWWMPHAAGKACLKSIPRQWMTGVRSMCLPVHSGSCTFWIVPMPH